MKGKRERERERERARVNERRRIASHSLALRGIRVIRFAREIAKLSRFNQSRV